MHDFHKSYKPHLTGDKTEMLKGQMTWPKLEAGRRGSLAPSPGGPPFGAFLSVQPRGIVDQQLFLNYKKDSFISWHPITEMLKVLEGDNTPHSSLLSGSVSWKHTPQGFRRKDLTLKLNLQYSAT